ncbi:ROK family transcriptional regulator [Conexibacter arvalis]|uniref:Putative NBD/HSP70 family sugar kinase n=1 Tax=Conexibacter arvalis TaxID=912552 RepID=A0A840I7J5_9ACTN|nr:ROK family transcriptional regulator [Conexibacter arvalis]MBB4660856.1 putative NBD/HSP70 family sugar kinase [Conexibacter arvalis]
MEEILPDTRHVKEATGSPALMRRLNAGRILRELRTSGPRSRAELARVTGLSKPTVNGVVEELHRAGWVEPVEGADGPPQRTGRPAQLYAFRADFGHVLGIDIGADKLMLLLADATGEVVARARRSLRELAPRGPQAILDEVARSAPALLAGAGVAPERLLAVVAGTPGVVSADGVVTTVPQLRDWEGIPLRARLQEIFDCPVQVDREVHLSLLAEQWHGLAAGLDDALYVQVGMGVGAALLVNGQVVRGADGGAGEIGLMPLGGALAAGASERGGFGPFETATGGVGIARRAQAAALTPDGARLLELAGGDVAAIEAKTVFDAAAEGDATARAIVDEAVAVLGQGIACLACALNPRTVIVSGGLSRAGEALVGPLRDEVARYVPFTPRFLISTLSDEAVALGAVRRATEIVERTHLAEPELAGSTR